MEIIMFWRPAHFQMKNILFVLTVWNLTKILFYCGQIHPTAIHNTYKVMSALYAYIYYFLSIITYCREASFCVNKALAYSGLFWRKWSLLPGANSAETVKWKGRKGRQHLASCRKDVSINGWALPFVMYLTLHHASLGHMEVAASHWHKLVRILWFCNSVVAAPLPPSTLKIRFGLITEFALVKQILEK